MEAGSAWDRLSLVTGKRTHPGRWLAAIIGLAVVFVLGFAGVLAWLLQQMPAHAAVPTAAVKKRRTVEPVAVTTSKRATLLAATPAPLAGSSATATPTSVVAEPVAAGPIVNPPAPAPTPLPTDTTPVPAVTPAADRLVTAYLDSVPPGVQIRLGDEVLGTTPCRVRLPRGDHQLIGRYQDWPETRQSIHLDGTETRAAVEIRMMRPDLVPGLVPPPDHHARRTPVPAVRRAAPVETPTPPVRATPGEPEVRPAQRVLTPFRIDEPADVPPPPASDRRPHSADDPDRD